MGIPSDTFGWHETTIDPILGIPKESMAAAEQLDEAQGQVTAGAPESPHAIEPIMPTDPTSLESVEAAKAAALAAEGEPGSTSDNPLAG